MNQSKKMSPNKNTKQSGYIILINVLIFMAVAVILLTGVVNPILSHYSSSKGFIESKKSFELANSATEEVLYRLKTNKNTSNITPLTLGSGTANITVSSGNSTKTVTIAADSNNFNRNVSVSMIQGAGASFSYGLQTGQGGLIMGNNSYVSGNVYSNGDIVGSNNSYVTGSVTVSNTSDSTADQTNGTTTPPVNSISFGGNSGSIDAAQGFRISTTTDISSARFYIKKTGTPNDVTVRIVADSGGNPYRTVLSSQTLSAGKITTSYNYVTIYFPTPANPSLNTTYWIVLDAATSANGSYSIAASQSTYANGTGKVGSWSSSSSGTWSNTSPSGLDIYFDLYVGGNYGSVTGLDHIGTGSVGDAWVHSISNIDSVKGTLYCQTSSNIGGGKTCDTSKADPVEQPLPVSDGNIADWEAEAVAGGTFTGNKTYSSGTSYLGPKKIIGNLTVNEATLKLTGTVYVTGNVSVSNNASINLDAAYAANSGVLIADGTIDIGNNGTLNGSGTSGSYLLVITNSTCPVGHCDGNNALNLENNTSGSSILNAQKGTLRISNNATAKEATAKTIILDENASVIYETGMADPSFSSGPSGSWYVNTWDETQ